MGIADEADRTLFVGNLDSQVTEELLFELFLQAGPLIKVKIPKNTEGNSKQFAFVNFKHEVSVPYSMHLLSGIRLYGRQLNLQYRAGSSHINQEGRSPANSQNTSPANTPTHRSARYDRTPDHMGSPSYSPPQSLQRSFPSPESLQKQVMVNNMWQVQMHQMQQLASSFQLSMQQQFNGGSSSSWQLDGQNRNQRPSHQQDSSGGHFHREQRHRRDDQRHDFYQHDDRGGSRNRDYPPGRHNRESRDRCWRRY